MTLRLLFLVVMAGCYEETDDMTFRDEIEPWASGTSNKTTPSSGEIALGHPINTIADSAWVNERSGVRDAGINDTSEAAQSATSWAPTDSGDRARMAAEWQHSKEYSTTDADGDLCRLDASHLVVDVTPGWDFDNGRGCVYFLDSDDPGSVYRANTWDVGNLTVDTLDLDLTYVLWASGIVSDGDNLYIAYSNTNTSTWHIAQVSLTSWTGLAVLDQDTGWDSSGLISSVKLTVPRVGVIGAFYADDTPPGPFSAEFGIWNVGTSWLSGDGNIGDTTGDLENTNYMGMQVTSNYDGIFAIVRTDEGSGTVWLVGCDVTNPATSANVPPAKNIGTEASTTGVTKYGLRAFKDQIVWVDQVGSVLTAYAGAWGSDITLRFTGSTGLTRSATGHYAPIVLDGNSRLWVQYRLAGSAVVSGNTSLVSMTYAAGEFGYNSPTFSSASLPRSIVSQNSTGTGDERQWLVSDGRNIVSIEQVGATAIVRVVTAPGMR